MIQRQPLSRLLFSHPLAATRFVNGTLRQIPKTVRFASTESEATPASSIPTSSFDAPFMPPPEREKKAFAMKTYKPRTPGIRHLVRPINDHLWKGGPFLPLTFAKKGQGKGGRNNTGRITVRHRGGGHKRRIRMVDFFRLEPGPHVVDRIERDPGRSGHIALITNKSTGKKSYILAADAVREGDVVQSYRAGIPDDLMASMGGVIDPGMLAAKTAWRGNCLPLRMIPVGTLVHAVCSSAKGSAVFCRSAGTYATIIAKDPKADTVIIRLQSGEVRRVSKDAAATVGVVSNPTWGHRQLGKAGRSRWLGIRPTVRGVAMNAADHPHGGGRGKSKGNRHPVSPWGIPTKSGYKTRKVNNPNKWVVTPRIRNQGKRRTKKS
ncbi:mitochondrial 54S ribosomal protein rml2 [Rhizina undulata]